MAIGCSRSEMRNWPYVKAKQKVTCSLPHSENERHRRVHNFQSCKEGSSEVTCTLLGISDVLATYKGQGERDMLPART